MKLLITGVCGFAGSTIARTWLAEDPTLEIYGMDNLSRPGSERNRTDLARLGIKLVHGDTRLASDFNSLPGVDWVIDAAANPSVLAGVDGMSSSRQLVEHNLVGTINMLEYCKSNRAGFILLSTSRVYSIRELAKVAVAPVDGAFQLKAGQSLPLGLSVVGIRENFSTDPPISLYGSTKRASEILALEYQEVFDVPVWINRCGVLAGAGQFGRADQGIFTYWINSWLRRAPLSYLGFGGHGYQVRDALHPRDLVSLLRKQTETDMEDLPRIINLGGGEANAISLLRLSDWCRERFGPHDVASNPETRQFDIPWLVMDGERARRIWDWTPQTSLTTILEEIAEHAERHPEWLEISGQS